MKSTRPYFIWEYDLSESDVRQMLSSGTELEKQWVLSRLLESARLEDVWSFTSYNQVREYFPSLKLKPVVKHVWEEAFKVWDRSRISTT